ncbi:MAG: hypothetical protein JSS75_02045 [Bacteroidetes bacterium]|nr:hypothetical protein [Bacteroidota bacterium]
MKRILVTLVCVLWVCLGSNPAPAQQYFQHWFRVGSQSETVRSFRSYDSTYVVLGNQLVGSGTSTYRAAVTKFNPFGGIVWSIAFPDSPAFTATSITEFVGSKYAITGTRQRSKLLTDVVIICIDQNGNMLWARDLGPLGPSAPGVAPTYQGGVVASYESASNPNEYGTRPMMVALDGNGNLEWARHTHDSLINVSQTFGTIAANIDEGVVGVGGDDPLAPTFPSPFVYWTMPSQGTLGADRIFLHDSIAVEPTNIYLSRSGNWIVAGQANTRSGRSLPFVAELLRDQIGWFRLIDVQSGWARAISESSDLVLTIGINMRNDLRARFLTLTPDGHLFNARSVAFSNAACIVSDISSWGSDPVIITGTIGYDSAGKASLAQYVLAVTDSLTGCNLSTDSIGVIEIPKSEFRVILGRIDTPKVPITSLDTLRIVRTTPTTGSLCENDVPTRSMTNEPFNEVVISPNPAVPGGTISFVGGDARAVEMHLFDITGKRRLTVMLDLSNSFASTTVPLDLCPGMYQFVLCDRLGGIVGHGKFVVGR